MKLLLLCEAGLFFSELIVENSCFLVNQLTCNQWTIADYITTCRVTTEQSSSKYCVVHSHANSNTKCCTIAKWLLAD